MSYTKWLFLRRIVDKYFNKSLKVFGNFLQPFFDKIPSDDNIYIHRFVQMLKV